MADQFTDTIRGLGRRAKRYGAEFTRGIRKKVDKPLAAALGTAGQVAFRASPEGQSLLGLSSDLRALTARTAQRPRGGPFTPPAILAALEGPTATASPLTEDPVRAQRHRAPGRYSRALGALGIGDREALQEQQEQEAANAELGEAMRANRPLTTEMRIARSNLPGERFGQNLGRFSERFQGTLGEFTQANIEYRDALGQGEEGVRPGAFQGLESPGEDLGEAMAQQEEVAAGRRQKRRDEFAGSFVPKEIRQRLVTAKKQGRRITPAVAMIEKKIENDKPLTPAEMIMYHGELGQQELASKREAETAQADRSAAGTAAQQQAIAGMAAAGMSSRDIERIIRHPSFGGGRAGGGMLASGGGLAAEGGGAETALQGTTYEGLLDQAPPELRTQIETAIADRDAKALDQAMRIMGIPEEERNQFGRQVLGEYEWNFRDWPIGPRGLMPGGWMIPKPIFDSLTRKIRGGKSSKKSSTKGEEIEEAFPGTSGRFFQGLFGPKRKPPKPPRKRTPAKPPRKRKAPSGPSASFPYPG